MKRTLEVSTRMQVRLDGLLDKLIAEDARNDLPTWGQGEGNGRLKITVERVPGIRLIKSGRSMKDVQAERKKRMGR